MEKQTVLILVHPGSACGSASATLGRQTAKCYREEIARDLKAHQGDVLVLDGDLSDELPQYPEFNKAIQDAVLRTKYSMRQFACDNVGVHFTVLLPEIIRASAWNDPARFRFDITGAWYYANNESGCVNGVYEVLHELGFSCDVLDSAVRDPEGEDGEEE